MGYGMDRCEDAPCCGCCGIDVYGVNQEADAGPEFCDACMSYHRGDCLDDVWLDGYDSDDEDWKAFL